MEDNSKWSKINSDISDIVEKFQEKIEEEDLVKDLRESIFEITENTKNIFRCMNLLRRCLFNRVYCINTLNF